MGASAFLACGDPVFKQQNFWSELLPNTHGVKDNAFIFLNPTKSDSKPSVSKMSEQFSINCLPLLPSPLTRSQGLVRCWSDGTPGLRSLCLRFSSSRPVRSSCSPPSQCPPLRGTHAAVCIRQETLQGPGTQALTLSRHSVKTYGAPALC